MLFERSADWKRCLTLRKTSKQVGLLDSDMRAQPLKQTSITAQDLMWFRYAASIDSVAAVIDEIGSIRSPEKKKVVTGAFI